MSTDTTNATDEPLAGTELAVIKARYDAATGGAWYFDEKYGKYFLASEHHGYMNGIGDLGGFGSGEQADADRDFVLHAKQDMAALLDEVDRLRTACSNPDSTCLTGQYCDGCQASDDADAAKDRELEDLRAENARLRSRSREDKRGRYLDSEGIGAGAEGDQLITWGGDVDQIEVRPAPGGKKVFAALGMLGLDPYKSPETCPQVRFTLTDEHARQLADGIYAALDGQAGAQ